MINEILQGSAINTNTKLPVKKPNFLFIIVDEQRFPPSYEDNTIKEWRSTNLKAQQFLLENGVSFNNHYTGSTACAPSRTTLYTGQYPSLHGVSQTEGGAKDAFDPDMFWLDPNTVPTFGDYLRTAGYDTFWKGKWHASHADILVPDTHSSFLPFDNETGAPIPERDQVYLNANRLDQFGFDGWLGPEPHGSNPHNSGSSAAIGVSGRDEVYSAQVVELLDNLQNEKKNNPWAIVASFVNPHDIATYGAYTRLFPLFNYEIDSSVPFIPPSPTAHESLEFKPIAQISYRETYPKVLQPLIDTETYRRLYYSLQLKVDTEVDKVLTAIQNSKFYDNTIIIYTSDHGELLGTHGGLFQKWMQVYEESIHVPLIIHNPKLKLQNENIDILTSHVDILPTLLGLAGIDMVESQKILKKDHTEVHPLVGRDLTPLITKNGEFLLGSEPIYFMTDDDPSKGLNQTNLLGIPYKSVKQPNHIETVIAKLPTGEEGELQTWKYSRYFDNPQFWSDPGCDNNGDTEPVPPEIEMYNLATDPIEAHNLAEPRFATVDSKAVQIVMKKLLESECSKKRLYPTSGDVPGKPACTTCSPDFRIS